MAICGAIGGGQSDVARMLAALRRGGARGTGIADRGGDLRACDDGGVGAYGPIIAAFDGRLDNRRDLHAALKAPSDTDPAALIAMAWEWWGAEMCLHVIGDFAIAVFDPRERSLFMATDPGAMRPLYFWHDAERLLFATAQRGLFTDAAVEKRLDTAQLADWLALLPRQPERTFVEKIYRVAPGHSVSWKNGHMRPSRWWQPESLPMLSMTSHRDTADAVRDAMTEAVRCRIGAGERIGAHLSAGLDSGSVTAIAARDLACQNRRLTAFTAVPSGAAPADRGRIGDEGPLAATLAASHTNIDHVLVPNDARPMLETIGLRNAANEWPVLAAGNVAWLDGIDRAAQDRGITVMLVASLGNQTFSYDGAGHLPALLRGGRIPQALKTLGDVYRDAGPRRALGALSQALPRPMYRALQSAMGRPEPGLGDFSAVRGAFLDRHGVRERAEAMACDLRNLALADTRAVRLAVLDRSDHRGSWAAGTRLLYGIDTRDPSTDRRVMELCLTIPEAHYAWGGVPRALVRRAMRGIVPDAILDERRRGLQSADWATSVERHLPQLRREVAQLREHDTVAACLDLDRMAGMLDAWPSGGRGVGRDFLPVVARGIAAGRFVRALDGGNA